eukprot:GSA25T00022632001.1
MTMSCSSHLRRPSHLSTLQRYAEATFNLMAGQAYDEIMNFQILLGPISGGQQHAGDDPVQSEGAEHFRVELNRRRSMRSFLVAMDASMARADFFGFRSKISDVIDHTRAWDDALGDIVLQLRRDSIDSDDSTSSSAFARAVEVTARQLTTPLLLSLRLDFARMQSQEDWDRGMNAYGAAYEQLGVERIHRLFAAFAGVDDAESGEPTVGAVLHADCIVGILQAAVRSTWPFFGVIIFATGRLQQVQTLEKVFDRITREETATPKRMSAEWTSEGKAVDDNEHLDLVRPCKLAELLPDLDAYTRGYTDYLTGFLDEKIPEGMTSRENEVDDLRKFVHVTRSGGAERFLAFLKSCLRIYDTEAEAARFQNAAVGYEMESSSQRRGRTSEKPLGASFGFEFDKMSWMRKKYGLDSLKRELREREAGSVRSTDDSTAMSNLVFFAESPQLCYIKDIYLYLLHLRRRPALRVLPQEGRLPRTFLRLLEQTVQCIVVSLAETRNNSVEQKVSADFSSNTAPIAEESFSFFSLVPDDDIVANALAERAKAHRSAQLSPDAAAAARKNEDAEISTKVEAAEETIQRVGYVVVLLFYALHQIQMLFYNLSTCPEKSHSVLVRGPHQYLQCASERALDFELENGGLRARGYLSGSASFDLILERHQRHLDLLKRGDADGTVRVTAFPARETFDANKADLNAGPETTEPRGLPSSRLCNTVIDVGANVGGYTLHMALALGYHVLAIEPHPENVANLRGSLMANNIPTIAEALTDKATKRRVGVTVVPAAISTLPERVGDPKSDKVASGEEDATSERQSDVMYLYERPEETGQSALYTVEQASNSREVDYLQSILPTADVAPSSVRNRIEVPLRTLDSVVQEYIDSHNDHDFVNKVGTTRSTPPRHQADIGQALSVCLLKIDAEGSALRTLESGSKLLRKHKPTVVVELDSAIARTVWPPIIPVTSSRNSSAIVQAPEEMRPGSVGGFVVDLLVAAGYSRFESLEDWSNPWSLEAQEFVAWQVDLLKQLRLGVWTAIHYQSVLWDTRFSEQILELQAHDTDTRLSEFSQPLLNQPEDPFYAALDAHFPASEPRTRADRFYVLCALRCFNAIRSHGCRCFDTAFFHEDNMSDDAGDIPGPSTTCRLFRSCAGWTWYTTTGGTDENQSAFDSAGLPRIPKMGTLAAWRHDHGNQASTQSGDYRAMELDNDLVAWPH